MSVTRCMLNLIYVGSGLYIMFSRTLDYQGLMLFGVRVRSRELNWSLSKLREFCLLEPMECRESTLVFFSIGLEKLLGTWSMCSSIFLKTMLVTCASCIRESKNLGHAVVKSSLKRSFKDTLSQLYLMSQF